MATLKGKADVSFSTDGKEWTKLETLNEVMMEAKIRKVTMIEVTYGDHKDIFRTKKAAAHDLAIWMIREKYGAYIFRVIDLSPRPMPKFYGYCLCRLYGSQYVMVSGCPLHHKLRLVVERLQRMILWHINNKGELK